MSNPAIGTGEYGDGNASDEQSWAASELYLTTGADSFATKANLATQIPAPATGWGRPSWGNVATLGWMSLQANKSLLKGSLAGLGPKLDSGLTKYAAKARDERKANGYHLPQGDLNWGGTSEYANSGILLWKAWMTTGDTSYRNASLEALDYLLGRNATGYCLVTGFGGKPVMNPHHRISFADGVVPPVPGFLSGGPNSTAGGTGGDGCKGYPNEAAKRFLDQQPCYESNEIAINWNSPLAYLVGVWSARLDGNSSSGVHQVALRRASRIQWTNHAPIISANQNGQKLIRLDLVTPDGRLLERAVGPSLSLSVRTSHSGFVLAKAWAADGSTETSSFLLP